MRRLAVLLALSVLSPQGAFPATRQEVLAAFEDVCQFPGTPIYQRACSILTVRGDDPAVAVPLLSSLGFGQTDFVHRRLLETGLKYHGRWKNPLGNATPGPADSVGWMMMQLAANYNGTHDYAKTVAMMEQLEDRNREMNAAMFQGRCRDYAAALFGLGRKEDALKELYLALRAKGGGWERYIKDTEGGGKPA